MASKRIPNVVVAAVLFLSFGVLFSSSAATVWVPKIQLEQYWAGGQWKDTIVDTTAWLDQDASSSIIHAVNSNPNGLVNTDITLNEYDADKDIIQQLQRSYDKAQGEWSDTISGTRWTRTKDNQKRDLVVEVQMYNAKDKKWYKRTRSQYHYHSNGLVDSTIEAVWDTSGGVGKWLNTIRIVDAFNAGKKSTLTLTDIWLKGDARWLKMSRLARFYNTKGLVTSDTLALWDTTDTKYNYTLMHVYEYNNADKDTATTTLSYSKALDDFLNVTRETFAYDNAGNQTAYVQNRWTKNSSGTGIWLQVSRQTQTYNAKSQILTTLYETYDSTGSKWNKGIFEEWAYDGNDNAQSRTFSMWDTTPNPDAFVPFRKLVWSYVQITVGTVPQIFASGIKAMQPSLRILPKTAIVTGQEGMVVSVYGVNGRKVTSIKAAKGSTMVAWNYADAGGRRVAKGNYVLEVSAPGMNAAYPVSICR